MRSLSSILPLFALPLFIIGCASPSVKSDYALDKNSDKALVVVSVTRPDREVLFAPPTCNYRRVGDSTSGVIGTSIVPIADSDRIESSFVTHLGLPSVIGKLAALELAAGEYEFYHCNVSSALVRYRTRGSMSLRFKISPGEVVYIGNIMVTPAGAPFVNIIDSATRDLSLVRDRWPRIPVSDAQRRMLSF